MNASFTRAKIATVFLVLGFLSLPAFANSQSSSPAKSFATVKQKAKAGDASAQTNLGVMYEHGRGVSKNEVEAVKWLRKAANQGDAISQFDLGLMYGNGHGVPKDKVEAAKWYRKAADQGLAKAQTNLGFMYAHGQGIPKDEIEGLAWIYISAASGDKRAADMEGALETQLGTQKALKARQRSKELFKKIDADKKANNDHLHPFVGG